MNDLNQNQSVAEPQQLQKLSEAITKGYEEMNPCVGVTIKVEGEANDSIHFCGCPVGAAALAIAGRDALLSKLKNFPGEGAMDYCSDIVNEEFAGVLEKWAEPVTIGGMTLHPESIRNNIVNKFDGENQTWQEIVEWLTSIGE